jgi:hypothetical protein
VFEGVNLRFNGLKMEGWRGLSMKSPSLLDFKKKRGENNNMSLLQAIITFIKEYMLQ